MPQPTHHTLRRLWRESSGQALVEFAIVAPLMVLVLLGAVWFYELVHVKLKVQEASRFAAWEATAMPLHDYRRGPAANAQLAQAAVQQIQTETSERYADLDSSTTGSPMTTRLFASSFTRPLVLVTNRQEEPLPGGGVVNTIASATGGLIDFFSAASYKNVNPVAMDLIASGKSMGAARATRLYGSPEWGFNRQGTICSSVTTYVQNAWFQRGVGRFALPGAGVMIKGQPGALYDQCLLADSWRLHDGRAVGGHSLIRPGVHKGRGMWEEVNRIYFVRKSARARADFWLRSFRTLSAALMRPAGILATPPRLGDQDWAQPSVISRPYSGVHAEQAGRVRVTEDNRLRTYDTAPLGLRGGAGQELSAYGRTLRDRGGYFMGCPQEMQLGCPSGSLQDDNPLGPYVYQESAP